MSKVLWKVMAISSTFAVAGLFTSVLAPSAIARPKYKEVITANYPDNEAIKTTGCLVCHEKNDQGKTDNKKRNKYGMKLAETLGAKDVKDVEKIKETLTTIEAEPSAIEGMTFGDLIKAGKLPAATE